MSLETGNTTTDHDTDDDTTDDGAFASGFDEPAQQQPTETPAAGEQVEDKPSEETPAVEYAQLTLAEYQDLKARAALVDEIKATQEKSFGTAFGKIGGIERTLQQLQNGQKVQINQEDIDALRDDFPPLAAALEKVRDMTVIAGQGMDEAALDAMVEKRVSPRIQRLEMRMMSKDHPDWREVDASAEFKDWVRAQTDEFKLALVKASEDYDSETLSDAMTKFKKHREAKKPATTPANDPAAARRSRWTAAATPRGSGQPASDATDPFEAGFNSE